MGWLGAHVRRGGKHGTFSFAPAAPRADDVDARRGVQQGGGDAQVR